MTYQIQTRAKLWLTVCAVLFLLAATAQIGVSRGASADLLPLPINVPVPDTVFHTDNFAKSMAMDGDTLVVGAPWTKVGGTEQQGVVYIYTRDAGDPTGFTLLKSITGSGGTSNDEFGWSVDIHGDTLVVGTARSPDGAAYVFERNQGGANNWGEVKKLLRVDSGTFTHFGRTVAIHGDTIAVAAPLGHGDVHIYQRNQGGDNQWGNSQLLNTGLPSDAPIKVASFGTSLAFDGTRLIISAPRIGLKAADLPPGSPSLPDNFVGSVFVYTQVSGQFSLEAKLFSSDIDPTADFIHDDVYGATLALNGDLLFVGATVGVSNGVNAGKVFVYQLGAGTPLTFGQPGPWGEVAQLSPSDGDGSNAGVEGDEFGSALYAVDDGLFVSSINAGVGKVYFYRNPTLAAAAKSGAPQATLDWSEIYSFTATSGNSEFGIPIVGSDNTIVIADQAADGDRGAIYAYPKDALFAADPNATPTPTPSPTPTETPLPGEPCLPEGQTDLHHLHLPAIGSGVATLQVATTASATQQEPLFLAPGCVVTGPGGVKFGVVQEAITQTIALTIEITTAPTQTMPAGVSTTGDYLRISSAKNKHLPIDKPFVIGIPVPSGADTAHLALGVLTAAAEDSLTSVPQWHFLDGLYDADQNLFLTTLHSVSAAGQRFVLAQHADFDSPPNGGEVQSAGTSVGFFTVDCQLFTTPGECTAATEEVVAGHLNDIYNRLTGPTMGFTRFPYLRSPAGFIAMSNSPALSLLDGFTARIEPAGLAGSNCEGQAVGGYNYELAVLTICYDPTLGFTDFMLHILIHEYFHATQYGYAIARQDREAGLKKVWITEGMATAAEESYFLDAEMVRSFVTRGNDLKKVDEALDTCRGDDLLIEEYLAQDFWVYVGQRFGLGLYYLATILEDGGVTNDGVFAVLENELGVPLPDLYWEFVKNQAIEHQIDLGEGPGVACQLTKEALTNGTPEVFPAIEQVYPFDTPSAFDHLPPLTAKVIEIDFGNKASAMIHVGYEGCTNLTDLDAREACNATARETIKMKLYLAGDSACSDEVFEADDWILTDLQPDERFFIVVANVQPNGNQGYNIGIE